MPAASTAFAIHCLATCFVAPQSHTQQPRQRLLGAVRAAEAESAPAHYRTSITWFAATADGKSAPAGHAELLVAADPRGSRTWVHADPWVQFAGDDSLTFHGARSWLQLGDHIVESRELADDGRSPHEPVHILLAAQSRAGDVDRLLQVSAFGMTVPGVVQSTYRPLSDWISDDGGVVSGDDHLVFRRPGLSIRFVIRDARVAIEEVRETKGTDGPLIRLVRASGFVPLGDHQLIPRVVETERYDTQTGQLRSTVVAECALDESVRSSVPTGFTARPGEVVSHGLTSETFRLGRTPDDLLAWTDQQVATLSDVANPAMAHRPPASTRARPPRTCLERDFAELASEARADNAAVRVLCLLHALSDAAAHPDDIAADLCAGAAWTAPSSLQDIVTYLRRANCQTRVTADLSADSLHSLEAGEYLIAHATDGFRLFCRAGRQVASVGTGCQLAPSSAAFGDLLDGCSGYAVHIRGRPDSTSLLKDFGPPPMLSNPVLRIHGKPLRVSVLLPRGWDLEDVVPATGLVIRHRTTDPSRLLGHDVIELGFVVSAATHDAWNTDRPSLFRCRSRRGTPRDLELFLVEPAH